MQNKELANIAESIENCNAVTRGEVNFLTSKTDKKT